MYMMACAYDFNKTPIPDSATLVSLPSSCVAMSEYSEFEDEAMEVFSEDASALTSPGLPDEAESYARKEARKRHLERRKSKGSFSEKPELKRHSSRTDLRRQLSKQVNTLYVYSWLPISE